jgi:uncharacterized protein YbbC (DUF1343 family)
MDFLNIRDLVIWWLKKGMRCIGLFSLFMVMVQTSLSCQGQHNNNQSLKFITEKDIKVGAQRTELYYPLLEEKSIGLVANHTSRIGKVHLADSLAGAGFELARIFSPEHGFRGQYEAGKEIMDGIDQKTGVRVVSLYGNHKKPTQEDLEGIEVMVYDIQDVGVRFYTYISTMTYVMEACAEAGIPVIILDRPNPNGFYVDGPVLDTALRSFVGLHPVPVVYGMTYGEYASMVNGEGWLKDGIHCQLHIVRVDGYDHSMIYKLPVSPSPNLPNWQSVYLYPSICLFEGTFISVGRGTEHPFQVIGHPEFHLGSYVFTPRSIPGVSDHPPFEGVACYGQSLIGYAENIHRNENHFTLQYLIGYYEFFKDSSDFFNGYFDKLAGTYSLKEQVIKGSSVDEIRKSWETGIQGFLEVRSKYLIYTDL